MTTKQRKLIYAVAYDIDKMLTGGTEEDWPAAERIISTVLRELDPEQNPDAVRIAAARSFGHHPESEPNTIQRENVIGTVRAYIAACSPTGEPSND